MSSMRMDRKWPKLEDTRLLGKRVSRLDGPDKVTGHAKYTYDQNPKDLLYAKFAWCPYGHAKIKSIDVSRAAKMPGVVRAFELVKAGDELNYAGLEVAVVAADTEERAREAARAIVVEYEVLPHNAEDKDFAAIPKEFLGKPRDRKNGDAAKAFEEAEVTSVGQYGCAQITHCCLESHGSVSQFKDDEHVVVWTSTQAISGIPEQVASITGVEQKNVEAICHVLGGGFGSKFSLDSWDATALRIAEETKRPVKVMLERDQELMIAGSRPSGYADVRVAAKKDGTITGWMSEGWGSAGAGGGSNLTLPYVFGGIPNVRVTHTGIMTNAGPARAWRAPGHPQSALVTMSAIEDLAAKLGMDPLALVRKNLALTGQLADIYAEELDIADRMMQWTAKWKPRDSKQGVIRTGLGLSLHTWGGGGHESNCDVRIHADGSVDLAMGTQDLGSGTKTVVGIVVAETLGLPLEAVTVKIGESKFPPSGGSGGSTTVGGVSSSARVGAVDAANQLFAKIAGELGVAPEQLEARDGVIRVVGEPDKKIAFKDACRAIGPNPIIGRGKEDRALMNSGVGGVQMAEVEVDTETGVVTVLKVVAVQDCGTIVDLKTAESQVFGGVIMGITSALYEERVLDPVTGMVLNPDMEFYRLAGAGDVGEIEVHMMQTERHHARGVIGLGEPPVISPMAAVANAVANALGVRVPRCPITPREVLLALGKAGA